MVRVYDVLEQYALAVITVKIVLESCGNCIWDGMMKFLRVVESLATAAQQVSYPAVPVQYQQKVHSWEIHGFSDASQKRYACSIYIRAVHSDASVTTTLG